MGGTMDQISPKERLFRTLEKKSIDRHAVICPGGMMNAAVTDVMKQRGHVLPEAHRDDRLMSDLARDVHELTGFENYGLPFCMTVEAEVLGSEIDFGTLDCEPKIAKEKYASVEDVVFKDVKSLLNQGRVPTVTQAVYRLHKSDEDTPVIGSLTGPISTAASIVDPMTFLKEMRKKPEATHRVIQYVTDFLKLYALQLLDNGADLILIADPTATGEILGPKMFREYAVTYLNELVRAIHGFGGRVIVHICGNMNSVWKDIPTIEADAISTDAMVNLRGLKEENPDLVTMGNLSTYTLQFADEQKIIGQSVRLAESNIGIISPACGLSTSTPVKNLQAFTGTIREGAWYEQSNL